MSKIILQPAGDKDASKHYVDSIANPTPIDRIAQFVNATTLEKLKELHKEGTVPTWGVTPGKKNVNFNKWKKVKSGDVALFSRDKKIFASAAVAFTIHNKELAFDLWKTNAEGDTWEYMYFLDEVKKQEISYEAFNNVAGYKPNNVIQGFNVLDEEKSQRIINYFELGSETYYPPVSREEYFAAATFDPSKSLDKEGIVKGRTEQAFLRNLLFRGKKYFKCAICGKEFPAAFLIAAHVKKRASCTDAEKRDFENIVAPMCKFGCDDLYEKGYIGVEKGIVVILKNSDMTDALAVYMAKLKGTKCKSWNEGNSKYFQWHVEKFK